MWAGTDWATLEELDNEFERLAAKVGRQIAFVRDNPGRRADYRPSISRLKDELMLNRAIYEATKGDDR